MRPLSPAPTMLAAVTLVAITALAACAPSLTSPARWRAVHASAESVGCFPYFTQPFREASQVNLIVVAQSANAHYSVDSEEHKAGVYDLDVERVVYGRQNGPLTSLSFDLSTDSLGHVYGMGEPFDRSLVYLHEDNRGNATVVEWMFCMDRSQ